MTGPTQGQMVVEDRHSKASTVRPTGVAKKHTTSAINKSDAMHNNML